MVSRAVFGGRFEGWDVERGGFGVGFGLAEEVELVLSISGVMGIVIFNEGFCSCRRD